jgi:hypothetical protein
VGKTAARRAVQALATEWQKGREESERERRDKKHEYMDPQDLGEGLLEEAEAFAGVATAADEDEDGVEDVGASAALLESFAPACVGMWW